jgi:hypothetical protein
MGEPSTNSITSGRHLGQSRQVVKLADVRMVQRRNRVCLAREPLRELRLQSLDGNDAFLGYGTSDPYISNYGFGLGPK